MSETPSITWRSSGLTDVGLVRELNEDAFLDRPDLGLWVVADGMGGHFAGDVASDMIVASLGELAPAASLSEFVDAVEDRLIEINEQLRDYAAREQTHTIGSTVAALLAHGRFGVCLWAGDSRVYRFRDGTLEQITQDHALVEELVERGVLTREQALDHPHGNLVTRAVGAADSLFVDMEMFELRPGDTFVLCSDGLDKEVESHEIARVLADAAGGDASRPLVDLALERGSRDNVTVIAVHIEDADARGAGPSPRDQATEQPDPEAR
ncbi:MAG: protein phosphatase 2C domain-containing protein [Gammaproteobacteria bacterium]|nr:protein phosphatase 2C domain-containing protein [Gammaproteobacteria bacterium]